MRKAQNRSLATTAPHPAPLSLSRLAFSSNTPSTSVQLSKQSPKPEIGLGAGGAVHKADDACAEQSNGALVFDIDDDMDAAAPSTAYLNRAEHAAFPVKGHSPEQLGLNFDIDDDVGMAAAGSVSHEQLSPSSGNVLQSHQQQHGDQADATDRLASRVVQRPLSASAADIPAQRSSSEFAAQSSQQIGLGIDIDDEPFQSGRAIPDRVQQPPKCHYRQQQPTQPQCSPHGFSHYTHANASAAGQQRPAQQSPPGIGLNIDIDDDTPLPGPNPAVAPSACVPGTCPQALAGVTAVKSSIRQQPNSTRSQCIFPSAPSATLLGLSHTTSVPSKASLPTAPKPKGSSAPIGFKPPRRTSNTFAVPSGSANTTERYAAGRQPTSQSPSASAEACEAGANEADEAVPGRSLKRLRKSGQSTATVPSSAFPSTSSSTNPRSAAALGRGLVNQQPSRLCASSVHHEDEEEGDDNELQAGLWASSQQWQPPEQPLQRLGMSLQEHRLARQQAQQQQAQEPSRQPWQNHKWSAQQQRPQQQQPQEQSRQSWHSHKPSAQQLEHHVKPSEPSCTDADNMWDDADDAPHYPAAKVLSSQARTNSFTSASAHAAANTAAASVAALHGDDNQQQDDGVSNACHGSRDVTSAKPSSTGFSGFNTARDVMQQQRESDRQAKADRLQSSNPFAKAQAQTHKVCIALHCSYQVWPILKSHKQAFSSLYYNLVGNAQAQSHKVVLQLHCLAITLLQLLRPEAESVVSAPVRRYKSAVHHQIGQTVTFLQGCGVNATMVSLTSAALLSCLAIAEADNMKAFFQLVLLATVCPCFMTGHFGLYTATVCTMLELVRQHLVCRHVLAVFCLVGKAKLH